MWSFTGNAAHTLGDTSWREMKNSPHLTKFYPSIGLNTGPMLLRQKKDIYGKSDLTIVTPSQWLYSLAQQSPVFEGKQIVHINNGVDLDVFRIRDRNAARAMLGIPVDARVLMFSAEQLKGNVWKGGKDLVEVLRISCGKIAGKVHLLVVGSGELESVNKLPNVVVHTTGYVHDEEMMANYLSASNVFVYPTKADNLPNVLVEAIACGTPCVTFNIGGCPEIIRNGFNGAVVEPFQLSEMADAIVRLVSGEDNTMRQNARHHAEAHFSLSSMGEQYHFLFASLLNSRKNRVSF
jgi:glycosyltransferase involved in cell wall biosynthesis